MTLVQPEGVLPSTVQSVSVFETALRSRRASGAQMTGQRQGQLIRTPATAATPPTGAHAAPGAARLSSQASRAWHLAMRYFDGPTESEGHA